MGNEYQVIEDAIIQCACGGKVTLTSTVKERVIAGKKPLYWKDIIGAPVACPRSKNPCTVVSSISTAGTEMNVGAKGEPYLLRTDGFTTDKGRAVVLIDPGQHTSKISAPPSISPEDIIEEEPTPEAIKEEEKIKHKQKYALYFLRKSEDIYKPLRPTRAFRKLDEKFLSKDNTIDIKDNVHVHTFAYIYITQNKQIKEYKVISKGTLYAEDLKDILFENTKTKIKYDYIPIDKDSNIEISYSSIKLADCDVPKLKRLSVNPKEPDKEDCFYFKDVDSINKNKLTKKDIETQKEFKQDKEGKQKRLNILCIIDDVLAEIEDMYNRYHTNYKLALAQNHSIIEDIKKINSYTYTIANMVDYFYVSKNEAKTYKESILELKKTYNEIVSLFLTNHELINLLVKDTDISKILEKDNGKDKEKDKIDQSYFQQIQFLKKDFFDEELKSEEKDKSLGKAHYSKSSFRTSDKYIREKYAYLNDSIKKTNRRYVSNMRRSGRKFLQFNSSNDDYTQVKDNASHALAHVLFALLYSEKFEDELQATNIYSKINTLRNDFLIKLRAIAPKPNISDNSIKDMQDVVEKQTIYHDIIVKPPSFRDKFLSEYEDLDYVKSIKSFEQKGEKVSFKSKYISYKDENYYKENIEKPKDLIKKIKVKIEDKKLKELLKIYENIRIEDKQSYVVSSMNIVYLLSAPRTYLDEETDINSFFNDNLNHIYKFVVNLTKKRIELSDEEKNILTFEYQISQAYANMQMNLILNDIIFSNSKKKALKFLEQFKVAVKTDTKTDINYKYIHDQEQNIKTSQREMYETLNNIEGYSSNISTILEKFKSETSQDRGLIEKTASRVHTGLKTYGNLISIAKVADYLFFDDNKKNISTHIGFVKDLTEVTVSLGLLVSKYPRTPMKVLESFLKTNTARGIKLSSKRLLNFIEHKALAKIAVITVVITTAFDAVKLYQREDYDALALTVSLGSISLALLLTIPTVPAIVLGAILAIVGGLVLNEIIDSDLDLYLKKSLLYKTIDFSIWKNLRGVEQEKKYQAPYLFETTNQKKELKAISNDGFNNPKKLVNFLGENYKGNEKYFDTSLRNELNFFKSAIFGYKLELLGRRRERKLKNHYGLDTQIWQDTFVKIPKVLIDNEDSKFIFNIGNDYKEIKQNFLVKENDYAVYDLLEQKINTLEQLTNINHKKASIIILSPQVELKYEFTYDYREIVYLDAVNFTQSSFTPQDIEELEQFIEKKEEK